MFGAAAEESKHGCDGSGAGFEEERLHQLEVAALDAARRDPIIRERVVDHLRHLLRYGVGGDRDDADAAESDSGEGQRVVTGEKTEGAWELGEQLGDLDDIAGRLLDADDVGDLGEAEDGGWLEVDAGATGDVVA